MRYYPDPKNKKEYIEVHADIKENTKMVLDKYNSKAKEIYNEMTKPSSNN